MRKAVIFGIVGLFMASGAAYAGGGGCGGVIHSAGADSKSQTVATETTQTTKPATKEPQG